MSNLKPYKTLSSKKILETDYLSILEDEFEGGNGAQGKYYVVHRDHDAVHALGLDRNRENFILVHEYRYPIKQFMYQVIGGMMDIQGETPEQTAHRELSEEAGYKGGETIFLGKISVDAARCDFWAHDFLILDCEKYREPHDGEAGEETEPFLLPVNEAWDFIRDGKLISPHSITPLVKGLLHLGIKPN